MRILSITYIINLKTNIFSYVFKKFNQKSYYLYKTKVSKYNLVNNYLI